MKKQMPMAKEDLAQVSEIDAGSLQVLPDIAYKRLGIVNIIMIGLPDPGDREWILIDAGLVGTASAIKRAAAARFGEGSRPAAIVLTHGHFDHVGALHALAKEWSVRVYAHLDEFAFLTGSRSYPPPDPTVGGLMALVSPLFPRGPVDVKHWLHPLPIDGSIPVCRIGNGWLLQDMPLATFRFGENQIEPLSQAMR